jgi:hypothetical protein
MRRYDRSPVIREGLQYGTSQAAVVIQRAIAAGQISFRIEVVQQGERLDSIAGRAYGDAKLWWILAAASNVGWCLQVPPGTRLRIPTDLRQISQLVS